MKLNSYKNLSGLKIYDHTVVNLRGDILRFVEFLEEKEIKRSYRDNDIPKAAALRLAKILSYDVEKEKSYIKRRGAGYWSNCISYILLNMGIINFDTKGSYRGHHSFYETYPDNYIELNKAAYNSYLKKNSLEKDALILEALLKNKNEFHRHYGFISSSRFSRTGSGVNASSVMDLPKIRREILSVLSLLEPGIWYDMKSLVEYFKKEHFNLIIDRTKKFDLNDDGNIYSAFYEGELEDKEIKKSDKDAYEKVEGRYLEYFMEYIPLITGFVALAVDESKAAADKHPAINYIKAFKVGKRLIDFYNKSDDYGYCRVAVQPNFEIVIDPGYGYAEEIIIFLERICARVKEDSVIILKLDKKKVADELAAGFNIDELAARLESFSNAPLPANVRTELFNWSEHSEKITLLKNIDLLELSFDKNKNEKIAALISDNITAKISDRLYALRHVPDVLEKLRDNEYMPCCLRYSDNKIFVSPKSEFSRHSELFNIKTAAKVIKKDLKIKFEKYICLTVAGKKFFSQILKILDRTGIEYFMVSGRLFFPAQDKETILSGIRKIEDQYSIKADL